MYPYYKKVHDLQTFITFCLLPCGVMYITSTFLYSLPPANPGYTKFMVHLYFYRNHPLFFVSGYSGLLRKYVAGISLIPGM